MDIDLSKVIGYSRDSLQSRALMRSIMLDMYPGKTREMNVLLDVYESGVPRKIKNEGSITDAKYAQYVQKIVDDYGMQEQWAIVGLNAWIDVCLGKGTAKSYGYFQANNSVPFSGIEGSYTNPIIHRPVKSGSNVVVNGNSSDYEIANVANGCVEIKKYVGFDEADMVIPTEISGHKVIGIGSSAFKACKSLSRLIIPEGIQYIENGAFSECSNLIEITLPTTLERLGTPRSVRNRVFDGVFERTGITKIDLPNQIKNIESSCFSGCKKLREVLLPDSVQTIGYSAFGNNESLSVIALPGTLKRIENGAFKNCCKLTSLQLNEGLEEIGEEAFSGCSLSKLTIPSTVKRIGESAFKDRYSFMNKSIVPVLYCYPGSIAIEYARLNNLKIERA